MRAILTYHSIDPSGSPVSVDEATFARHVEFLGSGAVRVVSLEDLIETDEDEDALALTFDDGFVNFATTAWPLLAQAGLPATVFLVSDRVGGDNRWGGGAEAGIPELPLMDWETAGRVASEGATLGAHSATHCRLDHLEPEGLDEELAGCRHRIEAETGVTPWALCYPYGDHDDRVVAAARASYRAACTTDLRPLDRGEDRYRLPRLDAYYLQKPGRLESYGTDRFRRYVSARAFLRNVRARTRRAIAGRAAP